MYPSKSNIGSLAGQSGFITVNQTTRIPIQTTTTQDVEVNSIVTPEVGVGNCRCTETVGIMWQPEGLGRNAHDVTKWSSPDQGFYWQNDVKNEGNPMPIMRLHKDGHLHVEGDLHCNRLHEQSPSTSAMTTDGGTVTGDLTVNGTVTATTLSVPSVLSTAADTLVALSGLAVTGTLTTANGNVDTRLATLEGKGIEVCQVRLVMAIDPVSGDYTTLFNGGTALYVVDVDTSSMWNATTRKLTVPSDGTYEITFVFVPEAKATGGLNWSYNVKINSSTVGQLWKTWHNLKDYVSAAGETTPHTFTCIATLSANESVYPQITFTNSSSAAVTPFTLLIVKKLL